MGRGNDVIGVDGRFGTSLPNGLLHHLHRVFRQQLENADVLSRPRQRAVTPLEVVPQLLEAGRQRPAIEHEGMIQRRRTATENGQIVPWFNDPFALGIAASVGGDDAIGRDHIDPINIGLDRHRGEGPATRNAVAIGVESHCLILVDFGRGRDERIKGRARQSQRRLFVLLEEFSDRPGLAGHAVVPLGHSTRSQIGIEFSQILHGRNRRGPIPRQIVDAVFNVGFFIAPRRHAEAWIETIVAGQRLVPGVQRTPPAA